MAYLPLVSELSISACRLSAGGDCGHEIKRCLLLGRKAMTDRPRKCIKKQRLHFDDKGPYSPSYGFSSGHVWMRELYHDESWAQKNWCFWTVVLESPLDCMEIKPVNPEGHQLWIFIERTVAEAEAPILWPSDAKSQPTGKDPDAGKD